MSSRVDDFEQERAGGPAPPVSVLICTKDRPDKLRMAVESVLRQSFRDFELIVVDQSAEGATRAAVRSFGDPRVRYLWTDTVGVGRSRNIAIRASRAEIVVFTDDDCVCDENWLAAFLAEYRREPSIMAVYGRVLPYGPPREGRRCVCTNESLERRIYDRPVPHILLGGNNNCSFRKALFREIGLYVDSLGAGTWMRGGEDPELLHRALRRRLRVLYSPAPLAYHNKWLDQAGYARLIADAMLGFAAVLVKFALELDGFAWVHLARTLYYILADRFGAGARLPALGMFALGAAMGVKYRFVAPPRLEEPPASEPRGFAAVSLGSNLG
jgi:glycosyltransferase involved in cell wall biosynthesis